MTAAQSAFLAALTAVDVLSQGDKAVVAQSVQTDARRLRFRCEWHADIAFHEASAAGARVSLASDGARDPVLVAREAAHLELCRDLIRAVDRVIAIPAKTKGDITHKLKRLKGWSRAIAGNTDAVVLWRDAEARWAVEVHSQALAVGASWAGLQSPWSTSSLSRGEL